MKAYKIYAPKQPGNLLLGDFESPRVGRSEVKIAVKAASANFRDVSIVNNLFTYPGETLPMILMSDGSGIIIEVGDEVTLHKIGDRVAVSFFPDWVSGDFDHRKTQCSLGGTVDGILAEEVVFDQNAVVKIPDSFTFEEAACFPCAGVIPTAAVSRIFDTSVAPSGIPSTTDAFCGMGIVSPFLIVGKRPNQ